MAIKTRINRIIIIVGTNKYITENVIRNLNYTIRMSGQDGNAAAVTIEQFLDFVKAYNPERDENSVYTISGIIIHDTTQENYKLLGEITKYICQVVGDMAINLPLNITNNTPARMVSIAELWRILYAN